MSKKAAPIIVRRPKRATHAHHGGAWKVAYADFVTADDGIFSSAVAVERGVEGTARRHLRLFRADLDAHVDLRRGWPARRQDRREKRRVRSRHVARHVRA